ncbi:hypothetical protein ED551_05230 [Muribaculaceae bacterium Isolate-013 (NCI)]|nr:hypothetical protein ED551_05230 [Muribaculaceae bacterium Isolate-013 (NCI)]
MKKIFTITAAALFGLGTANAEMLLNESFAHSPGSLASQGTWEANGSPGSYPINIIEGSLTHSGYQEEPSGNSVCISMDMGRNALQSIFAPTGSDAIEGDIYYSALVRVDEFPPALGKPGAIISLTGSNSYSGEIGDAIASSEGGGLFVKKGEADATAVFGISKASSPNGITATYVEWDDTEIPVGETALLIVRYRQQPGAADDIMELYVNPADAAATPSVTIADISDVDDTLTDIRGIQLCQRSALTSKIAACTVDELRVATGLDEIFTGETPPVTVPNITISENPIDFGQVYCNIPVERTVCLRATDLEGDITLTPGESGQVALSSLTIAMDDAMSEAGAQLTLTLTAVESRFFSDKITVSTPGMSDKVLQVQWHPVPTLVAGTLSQLCDEDVNDMVSVYIYTGEATVTFVESYYDFSYDRVVNSIFAQDATGGVELRSATGCGYDEIDITGVKIGDNITNIAGYLIFGDSGLTMVPRTASAWEIASEGNTVEPIELTLRQIALAADGYTYGNQLVKIKNVTFPDEYYEAGDYHGLWNSQKYQIFDGTLDDYDGLAWMWCNKAADYFKTSTEGYFDHRWTLTGIVNNYYPIHISPRSTSDFEDEGLKYSAIPATEASGAVVTDAFDLTGRRVDAAAARGVVLLRMDDGTVRKTMR